MTISSFFFVADDPGGGGGGGNDIDSSTTMNRKMAQSSSPSKSFKLDRVIENMPASQNRITTGAGVAYQSNVQQIAHTSNIYNINANNNSTNSSDLKYLHKKFKRIASATVEDNFVQSDSAENLSMKKGAFFSERSDQSVSQNADKLISLTTNRNSQSPDSSHFNGSPSKVKNNASDNTVAASSTLELTNGGNNNSGKKPFSTDHHAAQVAHQKTIAYYQSVHERVRDQRDGIDAKSAHSIHVNNHLNALSTAAVASEAKAFSASHRDVSDSDINYTCDLSRKELSANIISECEPQRKQHTIANANHTNSSKTTHLPMSPSRAASASPLNLLVHHNQNEQRLPQIDSANSAIRVSAFQAHTTEMYAQQNMQEAAMKSVHGDESVIAAGMPSNSISGTSNAPGRYVCPYCQLNCTKPSILRKHIRAHTNERPYPCRSCGFAFKTRSNLYKHYRFVYFSVEFRIMFSAQNLFFP